MINFPLGGDFTHKMKDDFYIDVGCILLAHKFTLDRKNKCDYSSGRGFWGISYAIGGEAEYRFSSGKRRRVSAGDVVFLPADTSYTIYTAGEYHHYTVNFTLHKENSCDVFDGEEIIILSSNGKKYYLNTFRALAEAWQKKEAGYQMRAVGMLYELLASLIEEKRSSMPLGSGHRKILPAKEYIDADPTRSVTIEELAAICGMSMTAFRRSFLAAIGQTPMRYRDSKLIALAKERLISGYFSVAEVAEYLGFEDASYFGRFFKKHTGKTPGEYK